MTGPESFPADALAAAQRAAMPDFPRWKQMITATGGCAQPIRLVGQRLTIDTQTGELIESYKTADEPTGYLLAACGNRRSSRCPACAQVYRDDTYHLIIAGMQGGKGVPEEVSAHPRAFVTLTAPSFGPVHSHRTKADRPQMCRPRRDNPLCPHGQPLQCRRVHDQHDQAVGQPICPNCYDYPGAVLWNAHAPELWRRFTLALPKALASLAGISRTAFRRQARVSYARVIEYQRRGLIHFHAIVRLDGPDGPSQAPPSWASVELLDCAIRQAADATAVPDPGDPTRTLTWGRQLDVQPVYVAPELDGIADRHVARYIAKYATKGAEETGTIDRPIRYPSHVATLGIPEHARRMIWTCFALANLPAYADLPLARWAHMLGFPGHFSTKSRAYSTTLTALRQARADHRATEARTRLALPDPDPDRQTITIAEWRYDGSGLQPGEAFWSEDARHRIQAERGARY
jgi:hypothetical protein